MKIEICGKEYTVSFIKEQRDVSHSKERNDLDGEISYRDESIHVLVDRSNFHVNHVLWHEILHGIVELFKIRELTDENGDHLEIPIDQLAAGITGVMKSLGLKLTEEGN